MHVHDVARGVENGGPTPCAWGVIVSWVRGEVTGNGSRRRRSRCEIVSGCRVLVRGVLASGAARRARIAATPPKALPREGKHHPRRKAPHRPPAYAAGQGGVDVAAKLRARATGVAYDRAGLGASELGPEDLAPAREVRDIHRALERLGLPGATVVIGHSYGGLLALAHADAFPAQVVGLVLVDPMNPRFIAEKGDFLRGTVPDIAEPATNRGRVAARHPGAQPRSRCGRRARGAGRATPSLTSPPRRGPAPAPARAHWRWPA